HLRERDQRRRQVAAHAAEGPLGQEVEPEPGLGTEVAKKTGVAGENHTADRDGGDEAAEVEPVPEPRPHAHRGGEEREAQHDKADGPEGTSALRRNGFEGVIVVVSGLACDRLRAHSPPSKLTKLPEAYDERGTLCNATQRLLIKWTGAAFPL